MNAYDNRIFYSFDGNGYILLDNKEYPMNRGSFLFWRAGIPYEIHSAPKSTLKLYGINFDFTPQNKAIKMPVPPDNSILFKRENILDNSYITDVSELNYFIHCNNLAGAEDILLSALEEYTAQKKFYEVNLSAHIINLITLAVRDATLITAASHSKPSVNEIIKYIQSHSSEPLTNKDIAKKFNYHPNYINHLMVVNTGMPLHRYLLNYRIQKAIHLLQNTDYTSLQIAEMTGFKDYIYFIKYFKKQTGYTTKHFRP